jgi:hypothetical protein
LGDLLVLTALAVRGNKAHGAYCAGALIFSYAQTIPNPLPHANRLGGER